MHRHAYKCTHTYCMRVRAQQYKNVRPDYLKAIWSVVNWRNVEERYAAARK